MSWKITVFNINRPSPYSSQYWSVQTTPGTEEHFTVEDGKSHTFQTVATELKVGVSVPGPSYQDSCDAHYVLSYKADSKHWIVIPTQYDGKSAWLPAPQIQDSSLKVKSEAGSAVEFSCSVGEWPDSYFSKN